MTTTESCQGYLHKVAEGECVYQHTITTKDGIHTISPEINPTVVVLAASQTSGRGQHARS